MATQNGPYFPDVQLRQRIEINKVVLIKPRVRATEKKSKQLGTAGEVHNIITI